MFKQIAARAAFTLIVASCVASVTIAFVYDGMEVGPAFGLACLITAGCIVLSVILVWAAFNG